MDAAVWTAIAIVAGMSFGTLVYLGSKIDALGARLDGRIDSLTSRVDAGFARIDGRLDALTSRLDAHLEQHTS